MSFINKPAQFLFTNFSNRNINPDSLQTSSKKTLYYIVKINANVRSGPSVSYSLLFSLQYGSEVELIKTGFFDSRNVEWFKIKYNGQEGYMSSRLLTFSRKN